ncbi:hypothetical protein O181_000878 [Austropuccinia psidii MF-1]|uniref:Uncharacterized protein n=1 Tax=Austropuccinia psidii MF-1 TaxID=1389203 RepID=A0A9Q3B9D8_9BASI|nr:hypothetical protein [Austropuccinia psidii MF-1]
MPVKVAKKCTENFPLLHAPRSSRTRCPCEDPFVVDNDESIPKQEWTPRPQTGSWECFCTISLAPLSINLSPPPSDGHFTPSPEKSDYPSHEGC